MSNPFKNPEYYFNRELSLLRFNERVLALAQDNAIPILERLKFLCICSSNLDEFYEIRVAGLKQKALLNHASADVDGLVPIELLKKIREQTKSLVAMQYDILNQQLLPALAETHIQFVKQKQWTEKECEWLANYFVNEILPIVSPISLDPAHPMPRLVNKSLNFLVSLHGKDAFGRESHLAVVHAPRALPRVIQLPFQETKDHYRFVFLSELIYAFAKELFPGLKISGCYQFRITRNSDLLLDEETSDLAATLRSKLQTLRYGTAVRLEISADCPEEFVDFLLQKHQLTSRELYRVAGPVNLARYIKLYEMIDRADLKYPIFTPTIPPRLQKTKDFFKELRQKDLLLHHPYESFLPIIHFIQQATLDPNVVAIKQTLYRTGSDSAVVRALIEAARAGKEVTAVIELRARFEEESNLALANRLQEAGVLVVYGVVNYKTHAKLLMIVRREKEGLKRYCHLGTGNYHAATAKQYIDYSLFTYNDAIGLDVQHVFQELTGMGKTMALTYLLQTPFTLYKTLVELIDREIEQAKAGRKAHMIIKVNALSDPAIIRDLYRASCAGVKIDLIVRGICCLRPGIKDVSENISVRSVLGRFLEHERVYYFYANGEEVIYLSSADWMERNLYHRIEVAFPILDKALAARIKKESLDDYLAATMTHWQLDSEGRYHHHVGS